MAQSRRRELERQALRPDTGPTRKQKLMAWFLVFLMLGSIAGALITYFAQ